MATNQRENARKEKKIQKRIKQKRIIWAVIIVVISILLGLKLAEIDYAEVKDKIQNTFSQNVEENIDTTITLDSPDKVYMTSVNDKLNVLTDTSYSVYNTNNKSTNYTFIHGYATPCIETAGSYTCLYDQGGNRIRLDTNSAKEYELTLDNPILCADVANNGTIIYATVGDNSKSKITLATKSLKKPLEYDVSQGFVTRVAVDQSGRKCAFVAVNTKDANLVSTVYTINANDEKPIKEFEFPNSNILDLKYSSSNLFVVCDNGVSVIKGQKNIQNIIEPQSSSTVCYTYTKDNQLIYVYGDFIQAPENKIVRVSGSGNIKNSFGVKQRVKYVSATSNEIVLLFDDKVSSYSLSEGELIKSVVCDSSVNSVVKMGSKIYTQRQQIIESFDF